MVCASRMASAMTSSAPGVCSRRNKRRAQGLRAIAGLLDELGDEGGNIKGHGPASPKRSARRRAGSSSRNTSSPRRPAARNARERCRALKIAGIGVNTANATGTTSITRRTRSHTLLRPARPLQPRAIGLAAGEVLIEIQKTGSENCDPTPSRAAPLPTPGRPSDSRRPRTRAVAGREPTRS